MGQNVMYRLISLHQEYKNSLTINLTYKKTKSSYYADMDVRYENKTDCLSNALSIKKALLQEYLQRDRTQIKFDPMHTG